VLLDARLAGKSGPRFQYRLAAPPELEVEHVSLRDEGVERVARWSRARDGRVTVFLSGPVAGKQELALRGRLATPSVGPVALPVVCLEGVPKPLEIQIFREPARHVEIVRTSGLAEIGQPVIEEGRAALGRLVKALSAVGPAPPEAMLRLALNRPRVRAGQVTRLRSEGEGWEADVEFQVRVSGGVVDEFHVDVPAAFAGPYKVTPPAAVKVLEASGKGNRQLVIRPRTAVQGSCRLQVSGPLAFPPGERIGAVKVVLEQAEIDRHVLVLPLQSTARRLAWETRGLAAVPVPADLAALPEARDSLAAFQVLHEPFQALLKSAERAGGRPQVLLADVRMAAGAEGTCSGLATFDVDPADLTRCPLHLPAPYALVSVFLGGMPANPAAVGPGRWEIPLGPSRLPQRIEVVFTGPLPETTPSGRQELAAPWLGNLDVRETLWSVAAAAGLQPADGSGQDRISRLQQELHRLRAIAAVLEMGLEARIDEPEDFGRWYPTWARRWSASHDELRRQLAAAQGTEAAQAAQADLETIERRQAVVAQRLGPGQAPAQPFAAAGPAQDAGELWPRFVPPSASAIRSASQGAATSIALVRRRALLEGIPDRLLVAAGLMLLGWLVVWAASRPLVQGLLDRWPQLVLAAVGLAWWLWLTPSGVGGGIVLAALLGAVGRRGRRRRAASRIARSPHFSTP